MKKIFLSIILILSTISCKQNIITFSDSVEYEEFKSTWVEPENYSFELHYDYYDYSDENVLDSYKKSYSIKIVKINGSFEYYLSDKYFDENFNDSSREEFEHKISTEELKDYIEDDVILSVADAMKKFDEYQESIAINDKKLEHNVVFTIYPATEILNADYCFSVTSYKNNIFPIPGYRPYVKQFSIFIENFQLL